MADRKLDDWINTYLDFTDNSEPPTLFKKWVAVSTVAAALRRKCRLLWGEEEFFPNFYIILVGPPATRKGTAMKPAKKFLTRLGLPSAADETSRQKLTQRLVQSASIKTDAKLQSIDQHCSLNIFSTELTVLLGDNDTKLISYLCKWFDCEERFQYDTISRDLEEAVNVWVNLLGATTPTLLSTALPQSVFGTGLISRTLFICAMKKGKVVYFPKLSAQQEELRRILFEDLERISMMQGDFQIHPDFMTKYITWRMHHEKYPPFKHPWLEGYVDRRPMHMLKLCMIMSASRSGDMIVTVPDMERAIKYLLEAEGAMPYAFQGMGKNPYADVQAKIIQVIAERGKIHLDELTEMFMNDVSHRELGEILFTLDQSNITQNILRGAETGMVRYIKKTRPISTESGELAEREDEHDRERDTGETTGGEENNTG